MKNSILLIVFTLSFSFTQAKSNNFSLLNGNLITKVNNKKDPSFYINDRAKSINNLTENLSEPSIYNLSSKNNQTTSISIEGLTLFKSNNKYGFKDKKGNTVVPATYDFADVFSNDRAIVGLNNKYGLIDKKGNIIVPLVYDRISAFTNGNAIVTLNNKSGFIKENGEIIVPIIYDDAMYFSEGKASVKLDKKWGFVNLNGKVVIPFLYDWPSIFKNGFTRVKLNE
ncbi:MAG: WG repeat-containing protein, partial [Sphingobacteriaceae bacterium]|nr:WG repeat-containing protein [Sphingobacteriaceae bacterium]